MDVCNKQQAKKILDEVEEHNVKVYNEGIEEEMECLDQIKKKMGEINKNILIDLHLEVVEAVRRIDKRKND